MLPHFLIWRTVLATLLMTAGAVGVFQRYFAPFLDPATAASDTPLAKAQTMAVITMLLGQAAYI